MSLQTWAALITDDDNRWIERNHPTRFDIDFHSGDRININITRTTFERLQRDFRITPNVTLPRGNVYDYVRYRFGFTTASRRTISGTVSTTVGSFYSGTRREFALGLNVRPRPGVVAELSSSFNRVELDEGNFSTKILRAVVDTQFNPFVRFRITFNMTPSAAFWAGRPASRWILDPGNDIYVVWLNNWLDTERH